MEESAAVAAQEYPAEFYHRMHNGDGDSSCSRVHGEREGTNPRTFSFTSWLCIIDIDCYLLRTITLCSSSKFGVTIDR